MELIRIDSRFFPSIYPDDYTERIFTENRVVELPLYRESFVTEDRHNTIDGGFAMPLKVRERIYRQYQLTIFAKESMRVDQMFMAGEITVYFTGEDSHNARVIEISEPEQVEDTNFLKYTVKYIDIHRNSYLNEPVSDFLTKATLLNKYSTSELHCLKLASTRDFSDPYFGKQEESMALDSSNSELVGGAWYFTYLVNSNTERLTVGTSVNFNLSGTVSYNGAAGTVASVSETEIEIATGIPEVIMSEIQRDGTTALMYWYVDLKFYTKITPLYEYSEVSEEDTEIDGIKKPSILFGSKVKKIVLFVGQTEYVWLKKYLLVLTGDNGTISLVEAVSGKIYTGIERVKPEIDMIDNDLYKVIVQLKYENDVVNVFNT